MGDKNKGQIPGIPYRKEKKKKIIYKILFFCSDFFQAISTFVQ